VARRVVGNNAAAQVNNGLFHFKPLEARRSIKLVMLTAKIEARRRINIVISAGSNVPLIRHKWAQNGGRRWKWRA
jgi:hypothetical protein